MKLILLLSFVLLIFSQTTQVTINDFPSFQQYIVQFNRSYDKNVNLSQYQLRQEMYYVAIQQMVDKNCLFCGVNQFTDWTFQELDALKSIVRPIYDDQKIDQAQLFTDASQSQQTAQKLKTNPASFDWISLNKLSPVKNQQSCGSCWTFSTASYFQSVLISKYNFPQTVDLSEKFLVGCQNKSTGCNGGYLSISIPKVLQIGGIPNQTDYTYLPFTTLLNGMCFTANKVALPVAHGFISYALVTDQEFIKTLIIKNSVSISVCSSGWDLYNPNTAPNRTFMGDPNITQTDHAVLLVGYTQTQWIVRNSWGTTWGVNGYIYVSRDPLYDSCIGSFLAITDEISSTCTVANCQTCIQGNICTKCMTGFAIRNVQGTILCSARTYANCKANMATYGGCVQCNDGYTLNIQGGWVCQAATDLGCATLTTGGCRQCRNGYFLLADKTCKPACDVLNCQTCSAPQVCNLCNTNYVVQTVNSTTTCKPNCAITNCLLCNAPDVCQNCQVGYILSSNACSLNTITCTITNCQTCNSTNICQTCQPNYQLSSNQCAPNCAISNCQTCNSPNVCQICATNYQLSSNLCIPNCAITNCQSCSAPNVCQICQTNYQLSSNQCAPNCGISNCQTCNSPNVCQICATNYQLSSNLCVPNCAITNCQSCSAPNVCQICQTNYQLSSNLCAPSCAISNCQTCNSPNVCQICATNYQLSSNLCVPNCVVTNCQSCNIPNVCASCISGFGISNVGGIVSCKLVCDDLNCNSCDIKSECKLCKVGYKLTVDFKCQAQCTVLNCNACSAPNICSSCVTNFQLITLNQVPFCKPVCSPTMITDGVRCKCPVLNYELNGTCYRCSSNCQSCTGAKSCTKCLNGFYLASGICNSCMQNCLVCSSVESCSTCQTGYQFDLSKKACLQTTANKQPVVIDTTKPNLIITCPSSCSSCKTAVECTGCIAGYYLTSQTCQKCKENCKTCSVSGASVYTCLQCYDRFVLKNNVCTKCVDDNCLNCQNDPYFCTICKKGYLLKNEKCIPCSLSYCLECQNNICVKCQEGYTVLGDGSCFQCISGCKQCSKDSLSFCPKCKIGSFFNGTHCSNCPSTCLTCQKQSVCTSCILGYSLSSSYSCIKNCDDRNCYKCSQSSSVCQLCYSGYEITTTGQCSSSVKCNTDASCTACPDQYYLATNLCQKCPSLVDNCIKCDILNSQVCSQCNTSYYLTDIKTCLKCSVSCQTCQSADICLKCKSGYYMELKNTLETGHCLACNQSCKTCAQQSTTCLSCYDNYQLSSHKLCLSTKKVQIKITFNLAFNLYSNKIQILLSKLRELLKISKDANFQITRAWEGSTNIEGEVSVDPTQSATQTYSLAQSNLQEGNYVGQFQILTSSIFSNSLQNPTEENSSNFMLIIILSSVGGFLLVVSLIIGIYCYKAMQKRKGMQNERVARQTTLQKMNDTLGNDQKVDNAPERFDQMMNNEKNSSMVKWSGQVQESKLDKNIKKRKQEREVRLKREKEVKGDNLKVTNDYKGSQNVIQVMNGQRRKGEKL